MELYFKNCHRKKTIFNKQLNICFIKFIKVMNFEIGILEKSKKKKYSDLIKIHLL